MNEFASVSEESSAVRCCTCSLPITTREIPRLEGEPCCQRCLSGFAAAVRRSLEGPALPASLIPWLRRRELGVVRAFVQTVSDGLSHPTMFFGRLPSVSQPWAPLLFAVVCTLVFYFPGVFINQTFFQEMRQAHDMQQIPSSLRPVFDQLVRQFSNQSLTHWMMLMLQFIMVNVIFASWIQQVLVYLAGSRRGFEVTLQVRCYSLVGMTFFLIPVIGLLIGQIYWIAINALGLREVHGISGWVSVLVAVSPLFVFWMVALGVGAGSG